MVLKIANVTKDQRMLILAKMNLEDEKNIDDNMCKELTVVVKNTPQETAEISLPTEKVLTTHGCLKRRGGKGDFRGKSGRGDGYQKNVVWPEKRDKEQDNDEGKEGKRRKNAVSEDGRPQTCAYCSSTQEMRVVYGRIVYSDICYPFCCF